MRFSKKISAIVSALFIAVFSLSEAGASTEKIVQDKESIVVEPEPPTLLGPAPPYMPRRSEYSLETGLLGGRDELFWLGAVAGKHFGLCMFANTHTCQQFADIILGLGVREGEAQVHALGSLRWQYVNFPRRHSPHWRLMIGPAMMSRNGEVFWRPAFGGGYGITTYLHEKVDLRVEVRGVVTDRLFVEGLLGFQFKMDRLLSVFGSKLKGFGYGTVETVIDATGTAIQATGEGLSGVVEEAVKPFQKEEKSGGEMNQPDGQGRPKRSRAPEKQ